MKHTIALTQPTGMLLLALVLSLALNVRVGYAEMQPATRADAYQIAWYTVAGGGGQELAGGAFTLKGTAGQFVAGSQSGGGFAHNGGFWLQIDVIGYRLNLPFVVK